MKKIISTVLLICILILEIPTNVFAGTIGGDNGGGGGFPSQIGGGLGWQSEMTGYRFTIINKQKQPVTKTVDILFSTLKMPTSTSAYFYKSVWGSLELGENPLGYMYYTVKDLVSKKALDAKFASNMPKPLEYMASTGQIVGQGEQFKKWFLSGAGNTYNPNNGNSLNFLTTSGSGNTRGYAGGTAGTVSGILGNGSGYNGVSNLTLLVNNAPRFSDVKSVKSVERYFKA